MKRVKTGDPTTSRGHTPSGVGEILRRWRGQRGMSQLDLATSGQISQRHLSFVESGRSVPSRKLLLELSDMLGIPLRERNTLFLAANYAPVYAETTLDEASMQVVNGALDRMLANHEPHPALLLDRYWNVLRTNSAAPAFFGSLIDLGTFPKPRNLLDLMFNPAGFRPHVEEWEKVAAGLLQRVRREAVGMLLDDTLRALLDKVTAYPGARELPVLGSSESPVLPITFIRGDERISFFSLITTVGTPQSVTAQELRLECMFPIETPRTVKQ